MLIFEKSSANFRLYHLNRDFKLDKMFVEVDEDAENDDESRITLDS